MRKGRNGMLGLFSMHCTVVKEKLNSIVYSRSVQAVDRNCQRERELSEKSTRDRHRKQQR